MSISKPSTLGIIACPGGEHFARGIIRRLRTIYKRKYDRTAEAIAAKYHISKEEAIRTINLEADLHSAKMNRRNDPYRLVPPDFQLPVCFTRFANGEFKAEIESSIRGMEIYIVQDVENHHLISCNDDGDSCVLSVNDHCMILFTTIDAVLQAGAETVSLVLPTYPFARQHIKKGREALTASMFSRIIEYLGVKRVITLDIHSKEIENSFHHVRLENLHSSYQILKKLRNLVKLDREEMVVVSPDTGAVDRNKFYAGSLHMPLALLYKERDYSKVSRSAEESNITRMRLLGSVANKSVFMADDLLGTGGTLVSAMRFLKNEGAREIVCAVSLPLFTNTAIQTFDDAYREGLFSRVIGTNVVYHEHDLLSREWYVQADVSTLFARILFRLHHNRSLSELLDNRSIIQRLLTH